ncbi:MAG: hypothetical protein LBG17_08435 [Bacteroidales bacterium]|jgi:hypothetical protein|nr:hypothetical protein [Bacteroidales bacterium]
METKRKTYKSYTDLLIEIFLTQPRVILTVNKKIVGLYDNKEDAYNDAKKKYPSGTFLITDLDEKDEYPDNPILYDFFTGICLDTTKDNNKEKK